MVSSTGKYNDKKNPYVFYSFNLNLLCFSQEYSVEILGLSAAKIKQTLSSDSVIYRIETDGLVDLFYPLENTYYSIFDPKDYNIKFSKEIDECGPENEKISN